MPPWRLRLFGILGAILPVSRDFLAGRAASTGTMRLRRFDDWTPQVKKAASQDVLLEHWRTASSSVRAIALIGLAVNG